MSEPRVIRVFVSSTFRDMQAEREELVKRVFPQLRKLCESRYVTWGEVDLRWGITDEQKSEGKVLPICLDEIQRCQPPYFIGMLGERYGWIPETIPQDLIDREPWLAQHTKHSVTELEILHGVLNNPTMEHRAIFYLRNPKYLDELPEGSDRGDFEPESADHKAKLDALKQRILDSDFAVRENYANPKVFGDLVLDDFTRIIETRYPENVPLDPLDCEAADQDAFAKSRAQIYIERKEYSGLLDAHAAGDSPPLVLLGESGVGKSALLANWALEYRDRHPDDLVLMHFIGATPYSADWVQMLRRLLGELKRHFNIEQEVPSKPEDLRTAFLEWLHTASHRGRVVLILDALNQLEDQDAAPDLVWLPPVIPPNIRLIVSTLEGRPLEDLKKRGWPTLDVKPLDVPERKALVKEFLEYYTKWLSVALTERIVKAPPTANPLYLTALLDELRQHGDHFTLGDRIEHYLAATEIDDLYERILKRYERDYQGERPGLVRDAMTALWAARRGLSEVELLDILGTAHSPMPQAYWSPLALAADRAFVNRGGLVTFAHDYLRKAVQDRYVPKTEEQAAAHLRLADYFEPREMSPRRVDELPWQLSRASHKERLKNCIADLDMFLALHTEMLKYELMSYWRQISDTYSMADEYKRSLIRFEATNPDDKELGLVWLAVARFFLDCANFPAAEPLLRRALDLFQKVEGINSSNVDTTLTLLGIVLTKTMRLVEAEQLLRRSLEQSGTRFGLGSLGHSPTVNALSNCIITFEKRDKGMTFGGSLNALVVLLVDANRLDEAEPLCRLALEICESNHGPDHPYVSDVLNNLALILKGRNQLSEAESLMLRPLGICENRYGTRHPSVVVRLHNLASVLIDIGRFADAEKLQREAIEISESCFGPNHPVLATRYNGLASVYASSSRFSEAESLFRRALEISEKCNGLDHIDVAVILNNLVEVLLAMNRKSEVDLLICRTIRIFFRWSRHNGQEHPLLRNSVEKYGLLLYDLGLHKLEIANRIKEVLSIP